MWFYIPGVAEWKGHCGEASLLGSVTANLWERGMRDIHVQAGDPVSRFFLDFNTGMIMQDADKTEIELNGLTVVFYTRDMEYLLDRMDSILDPRTDIGQPYHKVHGRFNCLCLTPETFQALHTEVTRLLPAAQAIAVAEQMVMEDRLTGCPHLQLKNTDFSDVPEA